MSRVTVIGAGLAGCEAAWQLAGAGYEVVLCEQKPKQYSPAHHSPGFAELVCSNSLKASRLESAAGLLKHEMERLGSLTVPCAKQTAVAAGGALAVDRDRFSHLVTDKIRSHPRIQVMEEEIIHIPEGPCVIATGPLTSDRLAESIRAFLGEDTLSFFDAAAPIVTGDSIDFQKAFYASRYGRGEDDYINCAMNQDEYEAFYQALITAESVELKEFDRKNFRVYEGCMPIEVMAKRGSDTIRFGPLKPVGLTDPRTGRRPWAVVQLRRENADGTCFNLVGFQTNLKFPEQKRVFSMIPGLENAEFVRFGVMHRNTFLDSPRLLTADFRCKKGENLYFAGQMTGVEGYMESAASGILAGKNLSRVLAGKTPLILPRDTMMGALAHYISDPSVTDFQPMGSNMGLLPPAGERIRDKKERYGVVARRAMDSLERYLAEMGE